MTSFEPLEPKTDVSQVWRLKRSSKIRTRTSFTTLQPQNYVAEAQMRPSIFRLGLRVSEYSFICNRTFFFVILQNNIHEKRWLYVFLKIPMVISKTV